MRLRILNRFIAYIPRLEAREKLSAVAISSFPHMDKKARERIQKGWTEEAKIVLPQTMSWKEVREILKDQPLEGVLDVATMRVKKPEKK